MDPLLLQQFRQQLAVWIETRLESQRLPFQRLEICPDTLTNLGCLSPDLVLWINRDSQLAGSIILLPDIVDNQTLTEGIALCNALGLGHFTTWAARDVSTWLVKSGEPELLHSLPLPSASQVTPEDFRDTLEILLEQLKVVTVTSAPPTSEYSEHYFANLCLRTLQELTPGLTISARMTAGETAADAWVEHAPREKAWLSLWRILFLLWHGRLPPGLQPEKLELAINYALTDLTSGQLSWLDIQDNEPSLPDIVAVRLHHLAGRLRQLGWPRDDEDAHDLLCLLLNEATARFGLTNLLLPWSVEDVNLSVACQPPPSANNLSMVAPRAYLAGWAFKTTLGKTSQGSTYAESLQALGSGQFTSAVAVLQERQLPSRKEREDRLFFFRQAWPSRRFDLPRNAPVWLWDAIYLTGLVSDKLSLTLPHGWHLAPGVLSLWELLEERYQLAEIAESEPGMQSLRFSQGRSTGDSMRMHRENQTTELPHELSTRLNPGTIQVLLKASKNILELLHQQRMGVATAQRLNESEALRWGLYIFMNSRLGKYLWNLCEQQSDLPAYDETVDAVLTSGIPIPHESMLADLSTIGSPETQTIPSPDLLEREFIEIFGPVPPLPESSDHATVKLPRTRRRNNASAETIAAKVFQDGLPRFPEHYLMHIYRPVLIQYNLLGPLEVTEEFFERISLRTIGQDHSIEVSGKIVAEALLLASYAGGPQVSLPENECLLEEVVLHYKTDLARLWDNLIRECRRFQPYRQAAIKMARKIWQQQGLPPVSPS